MAEDTTLPPFCNSKGSGTNTPMTGSGPFQRAGVKFSERNELRTAEKNRKKSVGDHVQCDQKALRDRVNDFGRQDHTCE